MNYPDNNIWFQESSEKLGVALVLAGHGVSYQPAEQHYLEMT